MQCVDTGPKRRNRDLIAAMEIIRMMTAELAIKDRPAHPKPRVGETKEAVAEQIRKGLY
jgi:hypothetical protein